MLRDNLEKLLFGNAKTAKQVVAKITLSHDPRTKLGSDVPVGGAVSYGLYKLLECPIKYDAHAHYGNLSLCDGNRVKSFKNEKEAKTYAKKNKIEYAEVSY